MSEHRFEPLEFPVEEAEGQEGQEDWIAPLGSESNLRKRVHVFEPGFFGSGLSEAEPEGAEEAEVAAEGQEEPAEEAGLGEDGEEEAPDDGGEPPPSEAEWRQALEEAKEQARQEGYREGYEQGQLEGRETGEEEGRAAMERVQSTMLDSFQEALDTLLAGHPQIRDDWQQPLARLVRAVAERVLQQALSEDLQGYLERLVRAALDNLAAESEVHVTLGDVTPGVVEDLRSRLDDGHHEHVRIHVDDQRPAHAVRVETHYGMVDTGLEQQLDQVVTEAVEGLTPGQGEAEA
jgi:flagellar assembly protein FliH